METENAPVEAAGRVTPGDLVSLVGAASGGDEAALARVARLFDAAPGAWDLVGDLGRDAERALVAAAAGDDPLRREGLGRRLEAMRREVAGPRPSPLERLLAERVAAAWLAVQDAELRCTRLLRDGRAPAAQAAYHERRLERAERRYLAAIKALAQVRRLLGPTVQINVGAQQVNLAR